MALLDNIRDACNGRPELLMQGVPIMYELTYRAQELLNLPVGGGETAGPGFEYTR